VHAYHLFPVQVRDRRRVYDGLIAAGIGTQVHYVPIYRHPLYEDLDVTPDQFPNTEAAYAGLLSLPLFPALTDREQDIVVETLAGLL
jgi:dTDP-4-amino-4,6-dideoxygalactose transaminase